MKNEKEKENFGRRSCFSIKSFQFCAAGEVDWENEVLTATNDLIKVSLQECGE